MRDYHVRVTQTQTLADSADVSIRAQCADEAARIVFDAVNGDPDDDHGDRRYRLPDGRTIDLDPERCVTGGGIFAEIIENGRIVYAIGKTAVVELERNEHDSLCALLRDALSDTASVKTALYTAILTKLRSCEDATA